MTESRGDRFDRLLHVMMRLCVPAWCPLYREVTLSPLNPYLIK